MGQTFGETVLSGSLVLAIPVALIAGIVSFLSPCVVPLVPGYLSYVTGLSGVDLAVVQRGRVVLGTLLFVLGFTAVFVSYGALFGGLGATLLTNLDIVTRVLGVITIGLGLLFAGWLPGLSREWRLRAAPAAGLAGAPVLGVSNGAHLRRGDVYASGTVSGTEPGTYGSLLELSWGGQEPITLSTGETRTYLEDGDTVVLRGTTLRPDGTTVGWAEVTGTVEP